METGLSQSVQEGERNTTQQDKATCKKAEGEKLSLVARHRPSTQPDPVGIFACQNNDLEEKVFVVWKWSEIQTVQDNGSYAFECYNNTTEYPKCNESTPINGYDIL